MKKVRISLRDSKKKWSFFLYETLSYYIYLHGHSKVDKHRQTITLEKGEFLEIEWLGVDYYQIDPLSILLKVNSDVNCDKLVKCDNIRIGKSSRKSGKSGFEYVTGYTGWVQGGTIPWHLRAASEKLKVIELKGRFKPRIDFSQLFENKEDQTSDFLLEVSEEAGLC